MKDYPQRCYIKWLVLFINAMAFSFGSVNLLAQQLEEIVVTAQRREQTLQEVPISINVYTGEQIDLQGYKNLDDLARYSATVNIADGASNQNTTIRGFGTAGSSLTLSSATPLFVDGIHFGKSAMIKNAFMDTERVEVLNGPQSLHFGMNASAGAFNITSKRPTDVWEGDLSAEFGADGKRELFGAVGGPLSDTLGIRLAGSYDAFDGVVKDRVAQSKFPRFDSLGGRAIVEWTPADNFTALTKFEINRQRNGGELVSGCIAPGKPLGYSESTIDGIDDLSLDRGLADRVYIPASEGGFSNADRLGIVQFDPKFRGQNCFNDEFGISRNGPAARPIITNIVRSGQNDITDGFLDIADLQNAFHSQPAGPDVPGEGGTDSFGNRGIDAIDAYHGLLDLTYEFNNGIAINSQTAYVRFFRDANADSGNTPFADSNQNRRIDMYQTSQQIRVEGPASGYEISDGINVNFMFGGFYQEHDLDVFSSNIRGNLRRGQRYNAIWEDADWKSAFWELNFGFMDDQVSLQVGGRYVDVHKEIFMQGYGASLLFDVTPCDDDPGNNPTLDDNPATCPVHDEFKRVDPDLTTRTYIDPITGLGGPGTSGFRDSRRVRVDSPRIYLPADTTNLWTTAVWRRRINIPLNYRGAQVQAIGLTAPEYENRNGPWGDCDSCIEDVIQNADNYSSQIVLSFTPNQFDGDHTFYANIQFTPEFSEAIEIGARGSILDGRSRYSVSGYLQEFTDLQTDAAVASFDPTDIIDQQGQSLNAGKQKVDGVEFNIDAAVTENWTVSLAGSIMNARFTDFDGRGCTNTEIIAASIDALENPSGRTAGELDFASDIRDNMGPLWNTLPSASAIPSTLLINGGCRLEDTPEFAAGDSSLGEELTIDSSGLTPAFAPPYKFVLGGTYILPVLDSFEVFLNAQGYVEGKKLLIAGDLDRSRMYNSGHWDMNISGGFGPQDGSWKVVGFVRNLMEDRLVFNTEYDLTRSGIKFSEDRGLSKSAFRSYGVRFEYNYR
jgi:outer membrane receptor protein involved in Fe transport